MDSTQTVLPDFDKLWNYSEPAATEANFREILPEFEAAGDPDKLAQLLTQIARSQGLQGRFSDADLTLDRVEGMLAEKPEFATARSRYLLERGRVLNSSGHPEKALPLFVEAQQVAERGGAMRYALDAIHMIAIAKEDPAEQIEWNLKGIVIAEADPAQSGWLWPFYNNIGESYAVLGQYEKAYDYFTRLAEFQKKRSGVADVYTEKDRAKMLRMLGRTDDALEITQPMNAKLLAEGNDDGWIREEIAESLHAAGRAEEARPHFARAYELLANDEYCKKFEPAKLERLQQMSR